MEPREGKIEYGVNPELVEQVENSKIDIKNKVNLLLVMDGKKPSSSLGLTIRTGEHVWLTQEDLEKVESILKDSGLAFDVGEIQTEGSEEDEDKNDRSKTLDTVEILISASEDGLRQLKEINEKLPSPQQVEGGEYTEEQRIANYRALGLAYGYPESAVNAFGTDAIIKEEDLPKYLSVGDLRGDAFAFSTFALSKKHWREELDRGKEWADCIKDLSPQIYNDMMKQRTARLCEK